MSRSQVRHVVFDAAKVRQRRGELKLSNEALARAVGVSLRTVQRWQDGENEPQNLSQARLLAQVLEVAPDELYVEHAPAA